MAVYLLLLMLPLVAAAAQAEEAAEHVQVEHFFLVLVSILVAAKLLGELAQRVGQPAVLGELIAGVLLGGSVLAVVPTTGPMGDLVQLLAEVGVAVLLFEIGLETDLREMARVGGSATLVALVGVVAPFFLGLGYWLALSPDIGTHPGAVTDTMVAIFVGATLTATSVGITARVLGDLGRLHTAEARVIIGAAVVDDVLGLVILAVVSGLAAGAGVSLAGVALTFAVAVGFLVAAVVVGMWLAPGLFGMVDRMQVRGVLLVSAFSLALLFAALAGLAGSAMIIGSFAAGIVLSTTNQFDLITEGIKPVADIFTPIFFVAVGAAVDATLFLPWTESFSWDVLAVGGMLLGIAVVGKVVSGYAVGWGNKPLSHITIGVGMVPRGEVGLIFAHLGLRNGILSPEVFSAILIMVMLTTFIAPPLLKLIFGRIEAHPTAGKPPVHPGAASIETASID
ncbi:MAG TPA: cation:proton antiporter [Longimicrobiales bacterium]|nr:cation:proton antiporter [Longimicrobiales bacterium]